MTNPQFSHLVNHRPTLNQPSDIESERFPGPMSCKNLPGERRTTSNTMQIPQKCLVLAPNCCKGHGKFQGFDGNIYIYICWCLKSILCDPSPPWWRFPACLQWPGAFGTSPKPGRRGYQTTRWYTRECDVGSKQEGIPWCNLMYVECM